MYVKRLRDTFFQLLSHVRDQMFRIFEILMIIQDYSIEYVENIELSQSICF